MKRCIKPYIHLIVYRHKVQLTGLITAVMLLLLCYNFLRLNRAPTTTLSVDSYEKYHHRREKLLNEIKHKNEVNTDLINRIINDKQKESLEPIKDNQHLVESKHKIDSKFNDMNDYKFEIVKKIPKIKANISHGPFGVKNSYENGHKNYNYLQPGLDNGLQYISNEDALTKYKLIENNLKQLERIVHVDLKGAQPKAAYFKDFFKLIKDFGATGILLEYEDVFPYKGDSLK